MGMIVREDRVFEVSGVQRFTLKTHTKFQIKSLKSSNSNARNGAD